MWIFKLVWNDARDWISILYYFKLKDKQYLIEQQTINFRSFFLKFWIYYNLITTIVLIRVIEFCMSKLKIARTHNTTLNNESIAQNLTTGYKLHKKYLKQMVSYQTKTQKYTTSVWWYNLFNSMWPRHLTSHDRNSVQVIIIIPL